MWIGAKCQLAGVTVDCDTVALLCKTQHIFRSAECADMLYGDGYCNGSATAAVQEYRRRFTMRRILDRKAFSKMFDILRECDTLSSALVPSERTRQQHVQGQENIPAMVQPSPTTSTRTPSTCLCVSRTSLCRTVYEGGLYPFHP